MILKYKKAFLIYNKILPLKKFKNEMEEIKNKILEEYKKGNIVVSGIEGLQRVSIAEFIKQPVDGMLYDLNRNESVVLTFLPDPKWVNDYAVATVIRALKSRIDELEAVKYPCR